MEDKNTFLRQIAITSIVLLVLSAGSYALYSKASAADAGTSTETPDITADQADTDPDVIIAGDESMDTVPPNAVDSLTAAAGDSVVRLNWLAANDDMGVAGYKIYRGTRSVSQEGQTYDLPVIPVGNITSYIVKNLTNDKVYYFAVTALDAAGNESAKFSPEASATPMAGLELDKPLDDGAPPYVSTVAAEDVISVKVEFSEPVVLPDEDAQISFRIEKISDKSKLEVQKAEIDERDETGKTVLLTTVPQENGAGYLVTVGIEVEDFYGNPIISGISDTGAFTGSAKTPEPKHLAAEEPADTGAPFVTGGLADFADRMLVNFSEEVVLPPDAKDQFIVTNKVTGEELAVTNTSLSVDGKTVYLTTAQQSPVEYEVKAMDIRDLAGNQVSAQANSVLIAGRGSAGEDTTPPEDVTGLTARIKDLQKSLVELRWQLSKDSAGDIKDQLLYQSNDKIGEAFGNSTALGTSTKTVEVEDLKAGSWYTFKVTTKDEAGNESAGRKTSIFLPQTGPGMLAAGLTALIMGWYRKRKQR